MQRRALLGSVAAGSVAVLAGCTGPLTGGVVQEELEESFLPADGLPVSVHTEDGDVDVSTHNGQRVSVDAVATAPSEGRLADATVTGEAVGGEFVVEAAVDGDESEVSVDLDVRVPEGTALEAVESEQGRVDVRGVASVGAARSRNGGVSVRDAGQVGSVTTENGDVAAEIPAPLPGDVTVRSENGDVDAWLSPEVDANVWARAENGYVEVDDGDLGLADRRGDSAAVRGVLGDGTHEVTVSSGNGTVEVRALA